MTPNFIIHHNTVINLNNVTCIYIKPLCEKNPETHQWERKGGKIMFQFSESDTFTDEVEYKSYETYEEAVIALSALADKLGAMQIV